MICRSEGSIILNSYLLVRILLVLERGFFFFCLVIINVSFKDLAILLEKDGGLNGVSNAGDVLTL